MEKARLDKIIAGEGTYSRREVRLLVRQGRVLVDGVPARSPEDKVVPEAVEIMVDGTVLHCRRYTWIMLHKPAGVLSATEDGRGATVLDLLPPELRRRGLFPVGRLDKDTEGLLLLTNDGELAQRLMHPRHHQPKTYDVLVRGTVPAAALATMRRGMTLAEGEALRPVEVESRMQANGHTRLRMVLHQGVNRQIRRMCRDLGLTILRLKRIRLGPLGLGDLPPGSCRFLSGTEVAALLQAAEIRR